MKRVIVAGRGVLMIVVMVMVMVMFHICAGHRMIVCVYSLDQGLGRYSGQGERWSKAITGSVSLVGT